MFSPWDQSSAVNKTVKGGGVGIASFDHNTGVRMYTRVGAGGGRGGGREGGRERGREGGRERGRESTVGRATGRNYRS